MTFEVSPQNDVFLQEAIVVFYLCVDIAVDSLCPTVHRPYTLQEPLMQIIVVFGSLQDQIYVKNVGQLVTIYNTYMY